MKLKITKREASFTTHINVRTEGSGDGRKTATDIAVSFVGTKRDIDNIVPMITGKFSDIMYDKAGQFLSPHLSPLKLHRKPEGLTILIYDQGVKKPLKFTKAAAKNIVVTFHQKRNCSVDMLLQVRPDAGQIDRLTKLLTATAEIEIEAEQEELFFDESEEGEEDGGGDEAQQQLIGDDAGEEEEEEEEEEQEDDEGEEEDEDGEF